MFIIAGPGSPSVLSNMVHTIEMHVDWIMQLIDTVTRRNAQRVVARQDAEDAWVQRCADEANRTLYPRAKSWYMGANIEGKPRVFMAFVTGVPVYRRIIEDVAAHDYEGFEIA